MDPHLEAIPGFGPFTTGSLSGGDAQSLEEGREMHFTLIKRSSIQDTQSRKSNLFQCGVR